MKPIILFLTTVILLSYSCSQNQELKRFESQHLILSLNSKGFIRALLDKDHQVDYLSKDTIAPLLSLQVDSQVVFPVSATMDNGNILFHFAEGLKAKVKAEEKPTHLSFELIELNDSGNVDLVIWGPVPTTIDKVVGETVGVVQGEAYAMGLQALNPKTLGGYPWQDNDCMPQFDIFEQDDYSDMSSANKRYTLYRVEAAKPEKFGSTLQAYCRNRTSERIISNLNHQKYISPVYNDGGVIGSKIALFGCPVEKTLETIGKIELSENLPHPVIDGVWGKQSNAASSAYLIYSFGENTIGEAIARTQQAGLNYLYHPGPFKNWGHFELKEDLFPNGWEGMKRCVEKAEKAGIHVGVHTLSNFITPDDPYVSPLPDNRLARVGSSFLSAAIDPVQKEIPIESPDFFNQFQNNNLHTVKVGTELIRYQEVSETAPWKLTGCQRGAWNTEASAHKKGEKADKLADHAYRVFLTDPHLGIEMAQRLAEFYNYCGLRQVSFDGIEGNHATGMGNYGEILFAKSWWDNLSEDIRKHTIIDASRTTHYFWHIYSRMNWGEPWYAGFRESQTEYRLLNQKYFKRNLMPAMLGWFSLYPNTSIEDIEWMLARSAGFDAGYALVVNQQNLKQNGQTDQIMKLVGRWEKARLAKAFSEDQKARLQDIEQEFHLAADGENKWLLYPVSSYKFIHKEKTRQPGEPLFSTFNFECNDGEATLNFILKAQNATLSQIRLELNHSREVNLPVSLKQGETIKYTGGNTAQLLDNNLQPIKDIPVDPDAFILTKGRQSVVLDCQFSEKQEDSSAKLEIRIPGTPEPVKGFNQ